MNREQAIFYIGYCVDDAMAERIVCDMPDNARLVGWQCGSEPMFVAVWSYLGGRLDDEEAVDLATDLLREKEWFTIAGSEPDYVI